MGGAPINTAEPRSISVFVSLPIPLTADQDLINVDTMLQEGLKLSLAPGLIGRGIREKCRQRRGKELDSILRVQNLHRRFGGVKAVQGADLEVRRGSITGLIGPNGAGKTTLFNLIAGTLKPSRGDIIFDGNNVTGKRPDQLAQLGLTRTFQLARGLPALTVLENFALYAKDQPGETLWGALARPTAARCRESAVIEEAKTLAQELNLTHVANNRTEDLSGGQKKLVELGRALLGHPKLLLLDEPMAGVNPALAMELVNLLQTIRNRGVTMLVIEHNMEFVGRLCDHVVVLASGKVLAEGSFQDVCSNEFVQSAYLGSRP
jgi:ABC-type branched-subunit amino acid transport system ATPase component